jgi:hypothetical protein
LSVIVENPDEPPVSEAALAENADARERIEKRAKLGNRESFLDVLSKVPDVEPDAHDRRP